MSKVALVTAIAVAGVPLARAGLCDIGCQAGGVVAAVDCKAAAAIAGGFATAAVPEAEIEIGMAVAEVWSLCDDYGVYWYNECTSALCGC